MSKKKSPPRAGAIEGFRFFFSEDRPAGPPPKPFFLTYVGDGVVEVPDIGAFQNGTTAEVGRKLAQEYRSHPDWRVTERRVPSRDDDDASTSAPEVTE